MKPLSILPILIVFSLLCKNPKDMLFDIYHEQVSSVGEINDELVNKFVGTYRILRQNGGNYLEYIIRQDGKAESLAGFKSLEADIIRGGFSSFSEFVKVNAKIAWAWNMAQAHSGLQQQENLQQWGKSEMEKGITQMQEALANPELPENAKSELRAGLEAMQSSQNKLDETYRQNMKWAEHAMKLIKPLANDREIGVVLRHEKELREVFTGLSREQLDRMQEHSMKALDIK